MITRFPPVTQLQVRRPQCAAVLGAALAVWACDGDDRFDPVLLSAAVDQVIVAMEESPAFRSVYMFGPYMTHLLQRVVDSVGPGSSTGTLPDAVLGRTFRYAGNDGYELSTETGAAANGVRFILYDLASPPNRIGYFELRDESAPSEPRLNVQAVVSNTTLLQYEARASTGAIAAFSLMGFIAGGTSQVSVEGELGVDPTGIHSDYRMQIPENNIGLRLEAVFYTNSSGRIKLAVEWNGNTTVIEFSGTEGSSLTIGGGGQAPIAGSITHNGKLAIQISGSEADPVFTPTSESQLSQQQIEALEDLAGRGRDSHRGHWRGIWRAFHETSHPARCAFALRWPIYC